MKLKHIFSLIIFNLFFGLILATNLGVFNYDIEKPISSAANSVATLALTGQISVDTQEACLNQTPPIITFTGDDTNNGARPYTFQYTYNGSDPISITTATNSSSLSFNQLTTTAGEFTYTLISITDDNDVEGTITGNPEITITVHPLPEVSVGVVSGNGACSGTPVVFSSAVSGDGPFTYAWSFGDGATSTSPNPTHTYSELGCGVITRTASLTVTDGNECSSTATQAVSISREPELEFSDADPFADPPFQNCLGGVYELTIENDSPNDSCIISYDVDWGDGSDVEENIIFPITHNYTITGVFNVTFTGSGPNCNATKIIEVANSTNAAGGILSPGSTTNLCPPSSSIDFVISLWHNNPLDTKYFIDYGDGTDTLLTQQTLIDSEYFDPPQNYPVPHVYTETNCPNGPYFINYEFVTACEPYSSGTIGPISLVSPPDVSFEVPEIVCVNTPVEFMNTSENGFSTNCSELAQWSWDFGDGTPIVETEVISTPENITHVFTTPGIYTVILTAYSPGWNSCLPEPYTQEVCVEAPLEPLFSVTETEACGPLTIAATNNTDESNTCEVSYLWNIAYTPGYCGDTDIHSFINGTNPTSINPEILFTGPGIYTLTLSATNTCGTVVSPEQIINVKPHQL